MILACLVLQNHLMQLLATVAMEQPDHVHPEDIGNEKVARHCLI